jgi:hypothetical protein
LLVDASELARTGAYTSASTSLVVTDPNAQLPATVESTSGASGKTGGKGRSVNLVDSEGKSVSSTKQ